MTFIAISIIMLCPNPTECITVYPGAVVVLAVLYLYVYCDQGNTSKDKTRCRWI
jgi:hypothetical protein